MLSVRVMMAAKSSPVYVGGGHIYGGIGSGGNLQDCDAFDGSVWTSKVDMPVPGRYDLAVSTIGSSGHVYGGYTTTFIRNCDAFDGSVWTSKADMPAPGRRRLATSTI